MARKLVIENNAGDIWIIDFDATTLANAVKELTGGERDRMAISLENARELINVTHAVYGDDIVEKDASGNDKLNF